ncbi:ABC transporter ATP-binding protein [Trebonia kvetii]|uniref:ABC transporter ATP-binding protein n=1 Tax=Trebonia kvetii TaxID=2480626 RepID=A0A6P2BQB9_9ACTN|nr:ABC transporter ATP-binding protein [Trebonia kvetii]TVY98977.1 ABC transporter ATP-binding protein [Trebonia kvetii]
MSVLEIDRLTAGYHRTIPTITEVSAVLTSGETVAVIGPNGAGKSTFIKAIFGLCIQHSGAVRLDGVSLTGQPPSKIVARGLGYVPQVSNVFAGLTVRENLEMGGYLQRREIRRRIEEVTEVFPDLRAALGRKAEQLSGGQRNMLALARALMTKPAFVLLDEPTAGLSPLYVDRVWAQVRQVAATGVGVLIVEQNARRALEAAQRGLVLVEGKVAMNRPSTELLGNPEVIELYLGGEGSASQPATTGEAS